MFAMTPQEYDELKNRINCKFEQERSFKDAYELFNMILKKQRYILAWRKKKPR